MIFMPFSLKTAKITGDLEGEKYCIVVSESNFFVVLALSGEEHLPARGKELLDQVINKITENTVTSLSQLQRILVLFENRKDIITLTLGAVFADILYLATLGGGSTVLKRDGRLVKLLEATGSVSGYLKPGDLLFVSSRDLDEIIPFSVKKEVLLLKDIDQTAEAITPQILNAPDSSGCAALTILVENKLADLPLSYMDEIPPVPLVSVKDRVRSIKRRLSASIHLSGIFSTAGEPRETEAEVKSKKTLASIAIILLFLLVLSIFFGLNKNNNRKKEADLNKTLELVTHKYDEATGLVDLNPGRARELLAGAKKTLTDLEGEFKKNDNEEKIIREWLAKIDAQESVAAKVYKPSAVPLFFDITLVKSGGQADRISLYSDKAAVLDIKNQAIYTLALDTKKTDIIAGKDIVKDARYVTIHGPNIYILNSEGIISIDSVSKKTSVAVKKDSSWGNIGGLVNFAANLYLLDKTSNQIWKYIATDSGLSEKTAYLNPDVKEDFTNASDISIDGSVWVLSDNLNKYTQGRPVQFNLKDMTKGMASLSAIYTDDSNKYIYLLDKGGGRIYVFDKEGVYQEAYEWDGLKNTNSFIVSEDLKKIFTAAGSKIYAIDIK